MSAKEGPNRGQKESKRAHLLQNHNIDIILGAKVRFVVGKIGRCQFVTFLRNILGPKGSKTADQNESKPAHLLRNQSINIIFEANVTFGVEKMLLCQ